MSDAGGPSGEVVPAGGGDAGEDDVNPLQPSSRAGRQAVEYTRSIAFFSGPLPPPTTLKQYSEVVPTAGERILAMAERQAEHRQRVEREKARQAARLELRGQAYGFVLALVALLGGMLLLYFDKPVLGAAAAIGSIATLAGLFVWSKAKRDRHASSGMDRIRNRAVAGADKPAKG